MFYVKKIEDVVKVTTKIKILDICNEHQDILDYSDKTKLIKEFFITFYKYNIITIYTILGFILVITNIFF